MIFVAFDKLISKEHLKGQGETLLQMSTSYVCTSTLIWFAFC